MVLEYVKGGELFDKIVRSSVIIFLQQKFVIYSSLASLLIFGHCRHWMTNFQRMKPGNFSSNWLMLSVIVMKKVFTIETWRYNFDFYLDLNILGSKPKKKKEALVGFSDRRWWTHDAARESSSWWRGQFKDIWFRSQCIASTIWGMCS